MIRSKNLNAVQALSAGVFLLTLFIGLGRAEGLKPTPTDQQVAGAVVKMLKGRHVTRHPLDDEISARFFDAFIDSLDPMKLYFLESDLVAFRSHRLTLDDEIQADGNLEFGFMVFDRFLGRVDKRVTKAYELIAMDQDYTVDEELVIDRDKGAFAATDEELDEVWRKRIKYLLLDKKAQKETLADARDQLTKRYRNFEKRMHQTDNDELLQMYLSALSTAYDPHTVYWSKRTLENFQISMRLELEGIGAQLTWEDGYTVVTKIIPGGAADRDGRLAAKDKIVGVAQGDDGAFEDVVDQKLSDVVDQIRGAKGTKVRLKVTRIVPERETLEIPLVRTKVELQDSAAWGQLIEDGTKDNGEPYRVGYIELPSFYMDMSSNRKENFRSSTRDVLELLAKFEAQNADVVVMDLRQNGGGSLNEAITMTGLFIEDGPVVQIKDAQGRVDSHDDVIPGVMWKGPLVVLNSRFSASASEIFAGAIKDYRRGIVVGDETTHGKGTVQTIEEVGRRISFLDAPDVGALKITHQQFYRANGASTQNRGVESDVALPSVANHMDIGEDSLDYALPFDRVPAAKFTPANDVTGQLVSELARRSAERRKDSEDWHKVDRNIATYLKYKDRKTVSLNEEKFLAEYNEINEGVDKPAEDEAPVVEHQVERDYYFNEVLAITLDFLKLRHEVAAVE